MQHDVETVLSQSSRGELWVCVLGLAPLQNVIHQEAEPNATEADCGNHAHNPLQTFAREAGSQSPSKPRPGSAKAGISQQTALPRHRWRRGKPHLVPGQHPPGSS